MSTDRIERSVLLRASRSKVWRALANPEEFGSWFGVRLEGQFTPGARVTGRITIPGYDHLSFELFVDTVEPESVFAYRWHPYAIDPNVDYSDEPTTLVEFHLADVGEGTKLTVTESGFDQIPPTRRDEAFRMNDQGWAGQLVNIERYVT
jgi:uncharacterized protein YndB with AHSA1/START domain